MKSVQLFYIGIAFVPIDHCAALGTGRITTLTEQLQNSET
jgi:hypothetical protein